MTKVNLKGLLLTAKRHLAILDAFVAEYPLHQYSDQTEVNEAQLILDELIEHVMEVQADNTKLEQFAQLYCLVDRSKSPLPDNEVGTDAIWEQAVKDVQDRYDELIKEKAQFKIYALSKLNRYKYYRLN